MDKHIKTWLYDILQSAGEIESYFAGRPKVFDEYIRDTRTKRAVERNLGIIGEAVSRIRKKDSSFHIENAKEIVGTRNRIIHGYDKISDEMIWSIIIRHLPKLRKEISDLLESGGE